MHSTVVAISTAPQSGAIGILRITGADTLSLLPLFLQKKSQPLSSEFFSSTPRLSHLLEFVDEQGTVLDQAIVIFYANPHSYTGEDLAEIQLHGNPILMRRALEVILSLGARPAEPGEFTKRAFLHGKMDLTQAEAVHRLITARSRMELEASQKNLFGELQRKISKLRSDLIGLQAEFEAEIDFSTEDLTFETQEERKQRIQNILRIADAWLLESARTHKQIEETKIVLYGEPNTGKSSLMNRLLGRDRSIISDIPGTTRDYVSDSLQWGNLPILLVDTAGIRKTKDTIERMGIERSQREMASAHLGFFLVDSSQEWNEKNWLFDHQTTIESLGWKNCFFVANKKDQAHPQFPKDFWQTAKDQNSRCFWVSCITGEGIEELISSATEQLQKNAPTSEGVFLEERQKFHLERVVFHLQATIALMEEGAFAEISVKEIHSAIGELGEIAGKVVNEEILGRIFSSFCVGK